MEKQGWTGLEQAVQAVYPEYPWQPECFSTKVPRGFWNNKDRLVRALQMAEIDLNIKKVLSLTNLTASTTHTTHNTHNNNNNDSLRIGIRSQKRISRRFRASLPFQLSNWLNCWPKDILTSNGSGYSPPNKNTPCKGDWRIFWMICFLWYPLPSPSLSLSLSFGVWEHNVPLYRTK